MGVRLCVAAFAADSTNDRLRKIELVVVGANIFQQRLWGREQEGTLSIESCLLGFCSVLDFAVPSYVQQQAFVNTQLSFPSIIWKSCPLAPAIQAIRSSVRNPCFVTGKLLRYTWRSTEPTTRRLQLFFGIKHLGVHIAIRQFVHLLKV